MRLVGEAVRGVTVFAECDVAAWADGSAGAGDEAEVAVGGLA